MEQATRIRLAGEILGHMREGTVPLAPGVMENPITVYTDAGHLAREREALFRAHPRIVGYSSQLQSSGDFVTDDLGGQPLLIIRGEDGVLRGFYNVCRHRGAAVESAPCGNQRRFSCPYHAWTYDTTGALRSVPNGDGFPDLDADRQGLAAVPVVERHGFVWLLPEGWTADDLIASLAGLDAELTAYGIADFVVERSEVVRQPFNWKLVMDGFLETYHLRFLHKATVGPYIQSNFTPTEALGDHVRMVAIRYSMDSQKGKEPEELDLLPHVAVIYVVFPNTILIWQADHFEVWTVHPDGDDPAASVMRASLLAPGPTLTEDDQLHWDLNWKILMDTVITEDFVVARTIQQGFNTPAQKSVVFGRNEPALQQYHRRLDASMARS